MSTNPDRKPVRLNRDGLPIDPNDWTVDDWRDLHMAVEFAKHRIRQRHADVPAPGADNDEGRISDRG